MGNPGLLSAPDVPSPPPTAPARPTSVRYQVLAVACSFAVLTYVHRLAFMGGTSQIKRDFSLDDQDMGWFWAAFLVAYALFQVPGGLLGDRFGARHLLTLLVLGWSLVMALVALLFPIPGMAWLTLALLLLLRFVFGMLQAGSFPPLSRVMVDWMTVRVRGTAQGMIWTFSRLGGALIPIVLLQMSNVLGGWRIPFLLLAGIGALWAAAFWFWFRNQPSEMSQVNAAERELIAAERVPSPGKPGPVPWGRMLRSRSVWGLCLMYGSVGFVGNFFTSLLALYLEDHRHLAPETAQFIAGLPLGCGIISCLLGGVLSDRLIAATGNRKWGRRLVPCVCLAGAALSLVVTPWVEQTWLLAVLLSATFFFNDMSMGPAWAACADIGERYAGTLSGGMNMVGSLVGSLGAVLAGALLKQDRAVLLFIIFSAAYAVASLCWLLVDANDRLTEPTS